MAQTDRRARAIRLAGTTVAIAVTHGTVSDVQLLDSEDAELSRLQDYAARAVTEVDQRPEAERSYLADAALRFLLAGIIAPQVCAGDDAVPKGITEIIAALTAYSAAPTEALQNARKAVNAWLVQPSAEHAILELARMLDEQGVVTAAEVRFVVADVKSLSVH